ncbi:angiotensin-converting enzyme-like [Uloborus diversus]|uniref:angiotensin-converting enzyme-like n=1 Tax=Uloborus diversus TaxID=327109 RepID=UPI002408F603|nr:angiotensin-converting enzyme-like [Uloborus diversus]
MGVEAADMKSDIERSCPEKNTNYKPDCLNDAKRFLRINNCRYRLWMHNFQSKELGYQTDLTEENRQSLLKAKDELSAFEKETAKRTGEFNWKEFKSKNETIFRWFEALSELGPGENSPENIAELNKIKSNMELRYSKTKICAYRSKKKCNLGLETDLAPLLFTSHDWDELLHLWKAWRDASARPMREMFLSYAQLSNEMAKQNSHMFSQNWAQIFDILNPFPDSPSPDITAELQRRKMKPIDMFKIAEEFFTSIGMKPMTEDFWQKSVIEKPKDKEMVCHPSAWNLYDGKDYRIKMCTQINMKEFVTVHHEMGHIEYYQESAHLPVIFQEGANPGFHEAVGDTMALSVGTPTHLKKIKLLENYPNNSNSDILFLLRLALEKVVYLPSSYIYDLWRWKVFSGEIPQEEMNKHWWKMRNEYEGLCPPVKRTEEDLDPLAKYHVATDTSYMRYFWGFLLQFQFHKGLCKEAGHEGPLHTCDIYQNKKAGSLFRKMLRLGKTVPWEEALSIVTNGEFKQLSATPLLEYFEPLHNWLKEQNRNEYIGWKTSDPTVCPKGTDEGPEGRGTSPVGGSLECTSPERTSPEDRSLKGKSSERKGRSQRREDTEDEPIYIKVHIRE